MKKVMVLAVAGATMAALAEVGRVDAPPAIDGRLDEAAWAAAKWETGFQKFRNSRTGRTPMAQTEFAIVSDGKALYFGIKAYHKCMAEVKELGKMPIWEAEGVEFNLVPDGGSFEFYKFLVTFQGLNYSQFYSEGGNICPDPFKPEWEAKAVETEYGWSGEARIPLAAFYMTRTEAWKTVWRLNVGRSYRDKGKYDFSCWADGNGFMDLKNFRELGGFPVRPKSEDIWVRTVVAEVDGPKDGKLAGRLKLDVLAAEGGEFRLETSFSAPRNVVVRSGANEIAEEASFPENGRLPASIKLTRVSDGGVCARIYPVIVDYQPIRVKLATPAYRGNFYPGQDSSRVEGVVAVAVAGSVSIELEGPGIGRLETKPGADGRFAFDTRKLAEGTATLTVRAGNATMSRKVRKLGANPSGGRTSWIENGNLVVDGKATLRRNMYAEYYMGGEAFKKKYDADDLHLTKHVQGIGTLEPMRLIRGIEQKEATKDVRPCDEIFRKVDDVVARGLASKTGVYYYISDEPECRGISPVYLKWIYDYVADKDPYHVVLSCSRAGERYIDCADWFETHPYINAHYVDGKRVYGRAFNTLGSFIDAFKPENHPDKCVGGTATCFSYSGGTYPTLVEYLANAWCEFVRGAKTLYPYAYHDLGDRPSLYEGTRYLFSSAEALEDFILHGARKTIAKDGEHECTLWTLPSGERMFAAVNFTTGPLDVEVKGVEGDFAEFRGARRVRFSANGTRVALKPLESFVFTTCPRGGGLPTFESTQSLVDRLEAERAGRDNQLLGRELDVTVTTSTRGSGARKMFDGTRDVVAWSDAWGKDKFYEIAFPKFVPTFKSVAVYGSNVVGAKVKIRKDGEWVELRPERVEEEEFCVRFFYSEAHSTVKLRFEFPKGKVELYEIELPRVSGAPERTVKGGAANTAPHLSAKGVAWTCDVPKGATTNVWWYVRRGPGQKFLVFDFRKPRIVKDGKYVNWGIYLNKSGGHLAGDVTTPRPGLYTLRLPDAAERRTDLLIVRNYNLELDMGPIACVEEPSDYAEFVDRGDRYSIKLSLAEPCEDVSCEFSVDRGTGPRPYSVNGSSAVQLKPLDATRRVWGAEVPVKSVENASEKKRPRPGIKITVLGGALDRPIFTNAIKADKIGG